MVPKDWVTQELDQLCTKIAVGLAISVTPFMSTKGVKLIRNQNIKRNYFDTSSVIYIDSDFANKNKSKKVKSGDVVAVRTGSNIGEACVVPVDFDGALTFTTLIARPNPSKLDPFYLATHINSDFGLSEVNRLMAGGGKPNLNSGELKRYKILTPPIEEQKKIAKILSVWDKAITTTEQLLANSQQQKKSLMQKLLTGKVRLEGFSEKWKSYRLGKVFKERSETNCIDLPLLSITTAEGVISRDDVGKKDTSNADKAKYRRICPNDIGYNTMRMWQGVSGVSNREGIVSPAYTILIPQNEIYPLYAAYLFKLPALINEFYRHSQGLVSDTWNLKYSHFSKIKWSFPDLDEQKRIAHILSASDKEIGLLEAKLNFLRQEKKALMQQLLTGKRRVSVNV